LGAQFRAAEIELNLSFNFVPAAPSAAMQAKAMNDAIKAYSIAVAPASHLKKFKINRCMAMVFL